ncbi:MAG TPA: hypothetical protein VEI02_14670 [Planctomycetota bacterium]|nr:hypothetical protein [Planctomycetota bacterium]
MTSRLRILSSALVAAAAAAAQDSRPVEPGRAESAPATRAATDPAALALFRKAAADQTPGDPAFVLRDFQADLVATLYETDAQGVRKSNTVNLSEFWRAARDGAPARLRRDMTNPADGKTTVEGFNGAFYWEKVGKAPARELSGRGDREAVRRIDDELARIDELAKLFLLRNLVVDDARFEALPACDPVVVKGRAFEVRGVRRSRPGEPAEDFFFADDDGATLLVAWRRPATPERPETRVHLGVHRVAGRGPARLRVPLFVESWENGAPRFEAAARDAKDLKFNVDLEDRLFDPPR